MKTLMCGLAMSFGVLANDVRADQVVIIDGEEYTLSALTENCQNITNDPAAQIACFSALSKLLEEQSSGSQIDDAAVAESLEALRAVAQYQDDDTGLSITGTGCEIHIVYFDNYFHISRRNISTIDLFSARFDVSKLQYDQTVRHQNGPVPLSKGFMEAGASAAMSGGIALDSAQQNFAPRAPGATIEDYANEVVSQLPARESATFDFVMVHPKRAQASAEIWGAFEAFVSECQK